MTQTNPSTRFSPYMALLIGILAVSTASIFIRFAQDDVPSLVIAAYRLSLATIFLAPVALLKHSAELRRLDRRDILLVTLAGGFLALHFASWITSLEFTTVASSVVLVTTTPLWVAIFSPFLLRESISRRAAAGLFVALVGGVIIGGAEACTLDAGRLSCPTPIEFFKSGSFLGNFLALFGAWMAAGYLLVGRKVRSKLSLVTYVFLVYGVSAVLLVMLALASGSSLVGYSPEAYLWLLLLALVPQLLGHSIFNWALAYLPASYVAVNLLGEPIGSIILAFFLLSESPTGLELFGAILILMGIVLATQTKRRSSALEADPQS